MGCNDPSGGLGQEDGAGLLIHHPPSFNPRAAWASIEKRRVGRWVICPSAKNTAPANRHFPASSLKPIHLMITSYKILTSWILNDDNYEDDKDEDQEVLKDDCDDDYDDSDDPELQVGHTSEPPVLLMFK